VKRAGLAGAFDAEDARELRPVSGERMSGAGSAPDSLPGLSAAGIVAFEDRQQVAQVGFGAQFFDQAEVRPDPVVFADERPMRQREPLIDVDGIERVGHHAGDVAGSPVILIGHAATIALGMTEGAVHSLSGAAGETFIAWPLALTPAGLHI
jgi:hypothetical protein